MELLQKAESTDEKVAHLQLELKRLEKEVIARDASLQIEKREHEATQKSLVQAKEYSEELLKRNDASSSRIEKLQEDIARLEEKASALEQENNSLLQTGAKLPPNIRGMASQRMSESYDGYSAPESPYNVPRAPMSTTPRGDFYSEDDREQNAFNEQQQQESQELLVRSISQYLGFVNGAPVAANLIYKCLLNWKSFEADRTGVLDRIIQKISSAIEDQDNNEMLAYWLSNLSTLVHLLQKIQRASGGPAAGPVPVRRRRMSRTSSSMSGFASNLGGATGSGTNFIQQIIMFLEKLLANIRENLKNELSPLLKLGTQAPKVSRMSSIKGPGQASVSPTGQWHSIVRILDNYMSVLKSNFVPPYIIQRLFTQMFRIMDSELFNSLLLRRESCSFSNGEFLKAGLVELESWCRNSTEEYVGTSYKDLKHIRQAVDFLVALQKPRKTLTEISNDICPSLSTQQLQRLSTMYWDDKYGTNVLSQQVAVDINQMMAREPNSTFMLNEESSPPLTMDDLSRNITVYEMRDSDLPTSIRNHPGYCIFATETLLIKY